MILNIIGTVGLPNRYGGFETLSHYLVTNLCSSCSAIFVYSESNALHKKNILYHGSRQVLIPLKANGYQSILYDLISIILSAFKGGNLLILGTSGTFVLPVIRCLFPHLNIIVNMAGLEWSRDKWGWFAKKLLKFNEWSAIKFSHTLIADNQGLVDYVKSNYNHNSYLIPYGGDQYNNLSDNTNIFIEYDLPRHSFDFAICRAQSDNNIELILETYSTRSDNIVFVSDWDNSSYGKKIKNKYSKFKNIFLIGPIFDLQKLKSLRIHCRIYIHGHSAGGTNPTLVEAMWSRCSIFAFDVCFHRHTTNNFAKFFDSVSTLHYLLDNYCENWASNSKSSLFEYASQHYSWEKISNSYLKLLR